MKPGLFLLIAMVLNSCAAHPSQDGKDLKEQLDALWEAEFTSDGPGGSILVKKGEEIIYLESFGLADLSKGEKNTEHTVFNTGSITKTVVANAILILAERGQLSLEDKLSKYFDDFGNEEVADQVQIKHLLSHTSGLPDLRNVSADPEFYLTAKDEENFAPLKQADQLNTAAGEKYQYSNPAFNGLALIIEKVTDQPWQEFVAENIFQPAGMQNSTITNGPHPQQGVAHGYIQDDEGQYIEYDYGEYPTFAAAGNGGVWSSVMDLARYEQAIQENVFLGKELTDQSRTVYRPENWAGPTAPFLGYGWFIGEEALFNGQSNFDVNFVYHTGNQAGFRAFYVTIPEKEILFVGLFNTPPQSLNQLIRQAVIIFEQHNWL